MQSQSNLLGRLWLLNSSEKLRQLARRFVVPLRQYYHVSDSLNEPRDRLQMWLSETSEDPPPPHGQHTHTQTHTATITLPTITLLPLNHHAPALSSLFLVIAIVERADCTGRWRVLTRVMIAGKIDGCAGERDHCVVGRAMMRRRMSVYSSSIHPVFILCS